MFNKKIIKSVLKVVFIFILIFSSDILVKANILSNTKILAIGSYSSGNKWENSILKGFESSNNNKYIVKYEFLDSKVSESKEYDDSFINFLNVKYREANIDYIIALDDESFKLIRSNLFSEELFTYKKKIIFVGVNEFIQLNEDEGNYITGILEYQDNLPIVNTILTAGKNIKDIYLILDNSIYCDTVKQEFTKIIDMAEKKFEYHIIQDTNFDSIKKQCKKIPDRDCAIYLCGTFKDCDESNIIQPDEVIREIKRISNAPIYAKLEEYIYAGAVGGIVNDGYKLGEVTYTLLNNIVSETYKYTILPVHDTFSLPIFNYNAIVEYDINPFKLPSDSKIINKKPFQLLLPKYLIIIVWFLILLAILGVVGLIYLYIINKRKARENKLLLVESVEREKIKTDFIVTISHELRTPLNIIINATNLLKMKLNDREFDKSFFDERLNYIMKNANRLRRYINNLIDVSKLEMGYMDARFTNENIVSVVEDITLTIVDLAKSFNLNVVFDTEEEEIIMAIDKVKMERIILNLLSNAIKFTNDGGKVMVFVKREADNVIIEICDDGVGMSEDIKEHLFEKFKRADLNDGFNRKNEGSGLGLFIVRGLVDLHNGKIEVKSKSNEGTKFIISLPIRIVEDRENENLIEYSSLEYMFEMEFSDIDKKE
ncbi:HAMP domain-containing sensor histidine kinase [Clostridium sp. D53t1_180928_C8]|uniref:sensor histidine kinase n=1 Tax=Clostridium sp. D53t1_180928_C8 TaxID=2787101 RepID=UPI0018A89FCD|nr:HAMP domain-containing sensor histidine kinase [Clostridium sp. D53t1_180928_C8]